MSLTDNLVAYWKFDESSGNASDSTENNNDLTNNNTVAYSTTNAKINNAADFVGTSSQYFSIADGSQTGLDLSGDFTFSFWCKAANGNQLAVQKRTQASDNAYYIERYTDNKFYVGVTDTSGTERYIITNSAVDLTSVCHIVITFTASTDTFVIYRNTSEAAGSHSGTFNGTIRNTTAPFEIGHFSSRYSTGSFDEFGIWSRVLSSGEISTLYNSGSGLSYPFSTTSIKTINGLAKSSVKTVNGLAIASVKNINGLA